MAPDTSKKRKTAPPLEPEASNEAAPAAPQSEPASTDAAPTQAATAESPSPKPGPTIYVGPPLVGLGLSPFTVFKAGAPPKLVADAAAADPLLKRLIVPVERLASARKELGETSLPLAQAARAVAQTYAKPKEA